LFVIIGVENTCFLLFKTSSEVDDALVHSSPSMITEAGKRMLQEIYQTQRI